MPSTTWVTARINVKRVVEGVLLFENESGWAAAVSGDKLGMVLNDFSSLRLVTLNACEGARTARTDPFAGVAGALVQRDIPAVVAVRLEISDEAAIVFAGGFYESLTAGMPVDASLGRGSSRRCSPSAATTSSGARRCCSCG